jgi:hypothetical protein
MGSSSSLALFSLEETRVTITTTIEVAWDAMADLYYCKSIYMHE